MNNKTGNEDEMCQEIKKMVDVNNVIEKNIDDNSRVTKEDEKNNVIKKDSKEYKKIENDSFIIESLVDCQEASQIQHFAEAEKLDTGERKKNFLQSYNQLQKRFSMCLRRLTSSKHFGDYTICWCCRRVGY